MNKVPRIGSVFLSCLFAKEAERKSSHETSKKPLPTGVGRATAVRGTKSEESDLTLNKSKRELREGYRRPTKEIHPENPVF